MLCPRDKFVLLAHGEDSSPVYFCETCHGLWFSREQLANLVRSGNSVKILPKTKILSGRTQRLAGKLLCPSCEKFDLSAKVIDGVEIDVCSKCHGIWLDAGELELIIARYRRKQKQSAVSENISEVLSSDPNLLFDLTDLIAHALNQSSEWASEAAAALLDFIGEAFSSVDF